MNNTPELRDALREALEEEHVGACEGYDSSLTCDVTAAFNAELYLWAAHIFLNATDDTPETSAAWEAIDPTPEAIEEERQALCALPHFTCPHCNAVNWTSEPETCGSCGKGLQHATA